MQNSATDCCYLLQTKANVMMVMMMMMQYTNCIVKAHKMQIIKLTLYKYKSWLHVLCKISNRHCWLL